MPTTVVAVGIDNRTAQLLTTQGYALENSDFDESSLYRRLSAPKDVAAPADAFILGSRTEMDADYVKYLRKEKVDTPAIRIVGPNTEKPWEGCESFLNNGGDAFLVDRHPEETAAVVRAVCRRTQPEPDRIERFESPGACIEVNLTKWRIAVNHKRFITPGLEAKLLFILASASGCVSYDAIQEELHGVEERTNNSIEVFACRLRKKMGKAACLFETRRGIGYELIGRVH